MSELPHALDRFELSRILGKGGMGTVYLARDQRLGRYVALKVLNSEELASDEARARFTREAPAAAAVRQQNVATIYEVGQTDEGEPFIVMEYCEGETLSQRLRRRPLDSGEFLSIARQLAAAVAAAHDNGVLHRDIKTANIIIEPTGLVKVLDFGLAKLRDLGAAQEKPSFASTSGQFFGTLHFLAPEQARGGPADERSDLFSIGVVLYQMASGHLPFNADGPLLVLEKIRDAEPEPFVPLDPSFPPAAIRIINKLLQKDPHDRYHSARDLLRELEAIDLPSLRDTQKHSRSLLGRTVRPRRGSSIAVAAAALVIVAVTAFVVQRTSQPSAPAIRPAAAASGPIRSMAVLPLANLANNTRDDFLSVGLADALVTNLQKIPTLQVRPTSAVMEFRNSKVDVRAASEKLQVDGILEGHFLAAGDLVRVNLQLTDSRSNNIVWADSVDGKRANLLKLIDDVSEHTVSGLNQKLGVREMVNQHSEPRSTNPAAYEQYLKARAVTGSLVMKDHQAQIAALKKAVELDHNFAAAYADLAIAISLASARGINSDEDSIQKAEWYARQAVRLDPNLPQAHLAMSRVFVRNPARFRESVREVLASLRLSSTGTHALNSVVSYLISTGDVQKAECVGNRIVAVDPTSNEAKIRGYWYVNAVDPEGALRYSQEALRYPDTAVAGHDMRALAFLMQGNVAEASNEAAAVAKVGPELYLSRSLNAMIAAARGDVAGTEAAIRSFEAAANRNHWAAMRIAMCYAKLGDHDKALSWALKSVDLGHHSWYEMVKHPWLQLLQADPQYQQAVAKVKADLDDVRDDVTGVFELLCK